MEVFHWRIYSKWSSAVALLSIWFWKSMQPPQG